ncbi:hypothetical protein, partial [Veronia pacifica]
VELAWTLSLNNASASDTTLLIDLNNLGNKGSFTGDTNGIFTLYQADGKTPITSVNMSTADKGIVKVVIPAGNQSVQLKVPLTNDDVFEGVETFALKATVEGSEDWMTADTITVNESQATLAIERAEVLKHGEEKADGDYTDGPAWQVSLNNTASEPTTLRVSFAESDFSASFDDMIKEVTVLDLNGNVLSPPSGSEGPNGGWALTNTGIGYGADIVVPAGEQGIQVFATLVDDAVYEAGETLSMRVALDDHANSWHDGDEPFEYDVHQAFIMGEHFSLP